MGLNINQEFGRVGINTTDAFISIKMRQPAVRTKSTLPGMEIDIQPVEMDIDQKQCFCEVGLKTADTFTRDAANKARQKCERQTAAMAKKGDFFARVNKNANAIPMVAKNIMKRKAEHTIAAMPKSRPKISFTRGMDISWNMGDVEVEAITEEPDISASRARVEVYLVQKPYIKIEYRGRILDRTI